MQPNCILADVRGSRPILDALYAAPVIVADYDKSRLGSTNVI